MQSEKSGLTSRVASKHDENIKGGVREAGHTESNLISATSPANEAARSRNAANRAERRPFTSSGSVNTARCPELHGEQT